MSTISACMIVQDEELRVRNAIENVYSYVDEIIIVDGGSKDKTVEICKSYEKVKLYKIPFSQSFCKQKNNALSRATKEWILLIDADELFDLDALENLQRLTHWGYVAYAFPRKTRIDGKLYNIIEPDCQIRLWQNKSGIHYVGDLHESPIGFKSLSKCNMWIEHNKSAEEQQKDNETYWNMGQIPPAGWYKENDKWKYKEVK